MAEQIPPAYQSGGCYTAQQDRQMWAGLICSEGVRDKAAGDLLVSAPGGMAVSVAAGSAWIRGDDVANQGMYYVVNDAPVSLPIAASDPTDSRIDLVVATVRDSEYSGTDDDWILQVIQGSPSPTPVAPALPPNSIPLATVSVPAGASEVTAAQITDEREQYQICSGSVQAGLIDLVVYESSSTFAKADYPEASRVKVECVGAGGGGGGSSATTAGQSSFGSGGGGGAYAASLIEIEALPASVTVTIGTGGTGGGADGAAGGDTSFGGLVVASGGRGGTRVGAGTVANVAAGANGGTTGSCVGDIKIGGGASTQGVRIENDVAFSGSGGVAGGIGAGGSNGRVNSGGGSTSDHGGGGNGALSRNANGAQSGGTGGDGVVVVEVYA